MKIKVMSDNLANKIAAGEVVERISSVVKELVENSIDAKSKKIIVDLINSGTKSIKVTDDGIGMNPEDALLCFERHATSKLLKEDDLFFINTLGFRGEALPSIASVSKIDMNTCTGDEGTHIVINGGSLITNEVGNKRQGTTIEVADLFYNTPARLKYLKSDSTELSNVTAYLEKLALANPKISFTLTNNEKKIVFTSGSGDLLKTIHEIYGYTVSSNMLHIEASNDDYDINGYICKPQVQKSNRNHITTIVNGRIVKNIEVNRAITDGYFKHMPDIKYPVVVLNIETDPTLIDVNIHPTKQDIKFSKINELTSLITDNIKNILNNSQTAHVINNDEPSLFIPEQPEVVINNDLLTNEEQLQMDYVKADVVPEKKTYEEVLEVQEQLKAEVKRIEMHSVGIVAETYIIAQNEEGMYIIDQHAAHERVNYERVMKAMSETNTCRKIMLIPLTLEYSASEFNRLKENLEEIEALGFKIEELGINTFVVKEHPDWLREGMEDMLIKQIFDIFIEESMKFNKMRFLDRVAATTACKMSVKAHESITLEQADQILKDLMECDNPYNCAHGRPTIVHYSNYELERMFKRVMN